jgi:hypothetical protein
MEETLLQEGIQAAKRGDNAWAASLLRQALEFNPRNIPAWLWLSSVVETDPERRECLESVLAIDPDNQAARYGLARLAGAPQAAALEPKPGPPPPAPEPIKATQPPLPEQADALEGILQELGHISGQIEELTGVLKPVALETARGLEQTERPRVKTALFVDFDNIYLGLKAIDPAAAERFATDPARWLGWIEAGMPSVEGERPRPEVERVVLIRQCYLNPRTFYQFRPYFTRSAFSVIDCPPLTTRGKTSSDIRMVMDILDTLQHRTQYDEFIILSGDADFTPVLFQLRANDYRTTVVAIGPAAEAYKAACDRVFTEDTFIEDALGIRWEGAADETAPGPARSEVAPGVLDAMAQRVYEEASASDEIPATDLPDIYKEFPEFKRSKNWLGFSSLRALTQELARRQHDLRLVEGDPWRVAVHATPSGEVEHDLRTEIVERVGAIVAEADEPVAMGKAAHLVTSDLGPQVIESGWAGTGSFKNLLLSVEDRRFEILVAPNTPGYLYDPERHERPSVDWVGDELRGLAPDLVTFIGRVSQVTGTPALSPRQYRVVFEAIADDVGDHAYNIIRTSKAVRDLCIERGESVSRKNVSFILRGITYTGHRFGEEDNAFTLGRIFRRNVLALIGDAQLEFSDDERAMLDKWILGGFGEDS